MKFPCISRSEINEEARHLSVSGSLPALSKESTRALRIFVVDDATHKKSLASHLIALLANALGRVFR